MFKNIYLLIDWFESRGDGDRVQPGAWNFSWDPTRVQELKDWGCCPLLSHVHSQGAGLEVEQLRLKPEPTMGAGVRRQGCELIRSSLSEKSIN